MRHLGVNAVFGVRLSISMGEDLLIAVLSGTAVYTACLPQPYPLRINCTNLEDRDARSFRLQQELLRQSEYNRQMWTERNHKWRKEQRAYKRQKKWLGQSTPPMTRLRSSEKRGSRATEEKESEVMEATSFHLDKVQGEEKQKTHRLAYSSDSSDNNEDDVSAVMNSGNMNKADTVLHIADVADEDMLLSLLDPSLPAGIEWANVEILPSGDHHRKVWQRIQSIAISRRVSFRPEEDKNAEKAADPQSKSNPNPTAGNHGSKRLSLFSSRRNSPPVSIPASATNSQWSSTSVRATPSSFQAMLVSLFHDMYASLALHALPYADCALTCIRSLIHCPESSVVDLLVTAQLVRKVDRNSSWTSSAVTDSSNSSQSSSDEERAQLTNNRPLESVLQHPDRDRVASHEQRKQRRKRREKEREKMRDIKKESFDQDLTGAHLHNPHVLDPNSERHGKKSNRQNETELLLPPLLPEQAAKWRQMCMQLFPPAFASVTEACPDVSTSPLQNPENSLKRAAVLDILLKQVPSRSLPLVPQPPLQIGASANSSTSPFRSASSNIVELTPMSHMSQSIIEAYLGHIRIHLIKEVWNINSQDGALSSFAQRFMYESSALLRAHVIARGGNAAIGMKYEELRFESNRGQVYAILAVSAEVVLATKV